MTQFSLRFYPLVLILVLLAGCARSPQAKRDAYLAKGKRQMEQQNYARALIEFRNAAQAMPNDPDAYCQMGIAYSFLQDYRMAFTAFQKALDLDPKHRETQLRMSQLLALADDKELLKEAESRLQALKTQGDSSTETLNTLALTEYKLGNLNSAAQLLQQVLANSPGELGASVLLAMTKRSQNDLRGAEDVLVKSCQKTPQSAACWRALGAFYADQKRFAEAESNLQKAVSLDPNDSVASTMLAQLLLVQNRKSEAEQVYQKLSKFPDSKTAYAGFLYREGRREEAVAELERQWKQFPEDRTVRANLLAVYQALQRQADVDRILQAVLKNNPKDSEALIQRAERLIQERKYADAERDLNQVLQLRPNSPEAHYVMARLQLARGMTLRYRQELTEALRLDPGLYPIRVELAQNLTNSREPKAALDLLDATPKPQQTLLPILIQKNWAYWALGEMAAMRKGIDEGLAQSRSADLLIQDSLWKLRTGNIKAARAALEEVLKAHAPDVRALQLLRMTATNQQDAMFVLQQIKDYAARHSKSAPVQHLLATMLLTRGDLPAARKAFETAKQLDPKWAQVDFGLAQMAVVEGNPQAAATTLEALLQHPDANVQKTARLWLANIHVIRNSRDAAIENYRSVLTFDSRNTEALNNLAYLLAEKGESLDEALKYAEQAVELAPDEPLYLDTLGWVLYRKGIYQRAIQYLERAVQKNPHTNVVARYHLAMAYAKHGDRERSKAALEAALKANPKLPEARAAQEIVLGTP